jgi:hypothetical protein
MDKKVFRTGCFPQMMAKVKEDLSQAKASL